MKNEKIIAAILCGIELISASVIPEEVELETVKEACEKLSPQAQWIFC